MTEGKRDFNVTIISESLQYNINVGDIQTATVNINYSKYQLKCGSVTHWYLSYDVTGFEKSYLPCTISEKYQFQLFEVLYFEKESSSLHAICNGFVAIHNLSIYIPSVE